MSDNPSIWTDEEYNTGLTLDHTKVANFIPATKPESKEDKIAFINNFERRGGWYYPGRHAAGDTYALNVKLYGAVKIPDEFLAVTDTEWFYQDWHNHDVAHLEAEFVVKHKDYSTSFAGRSGGYLILQCGNCNIDEPQVDEDTEEYEEVYERYDHWQRWWKRYINLSLHDGHKRRLTKIVDDIANQYGLTQIASFLGGNKSAYETVQHIARLNFIQIDTHRNTASVNKVEVFKLLYKLDGVLYTDVLAAGMAIGLAVRDEITQYSRDWAEYNIKARQMYTKRYGAEAIKKPDALLTWEDEDLDDLFNVLWDFRVLAQSLAMSFAYKCFWDTCQVKSEEVVDTEEEIG